jgi:hypothetical protein
VESAGPQHDETIVPVRPVLRGAAATPDQPAEAGAGARLRRTVVVALGAAGAVAAVTVAFYWLPERLDEQQRVAADAAAAAAAKPAITAPALPALSPEERAALKAQAEDLLAGLLTLQDQLTRLHVETWANDDWLRYRELSDAADNAFLAEDFRSAVAGYTEATEFGNTLAKRAGAAVESSLAAADAAVAAGNSQLAIQQYDIVLAIEPTHASALAGRARAERLPDVLALLQRAEGERVRGELEAALATYREALAIDPKWQAASVGAAEIARSLREAEFDRVLSAGFAALTDEDFNAAHERFTAALALRPSSREAQDGLAQAEEGAKLDRLKLAEARALAFERRELWDQAIALYRSVLESDRTLVFAQTGLERASARAGLDAKLSNLLSNPALLFGDTVLADARKLVEEAAAQAEKGPRLTGQIDDLTRLIDVASTPIAVRLTSDQLTSVTLYRVGTLGTFMDRNVDLRPGTYTIIGSRDGYRDVRQTFTVRPGRNLPPINVVCVEPI